MSSAAKYNAAPTFTASLLGDIHAQAANTSDASVSVAKLDKHAAIVSTVLNVLNEAWSPSSALRKYRDVTEKQPSVTKRDYWSLSLLVGALHLAAFWVYVHTDHHSSEIKPEKTEVEVEFFKPEIPPPPPKVEPPPPPKVPPKVQPQEPPRPTPALRTPVAEQNIQADDMTVKENTEAPRSTGPVVAEAPPPSPPPAPPAPPKEEPITEAVGYAGYLKNPVPDYPPQAQRQGWEGKVILRVRVLANGTVGGVEVKQSSGRRILDEAAANTVKSWMFSPTKRGNTPIDGWATVPIEFKL